MSSNNTNVDIVEGLGGRTLCCFLAATGSSPTPNANDLQKVEFRVPLSNGFYVLMDSHSEHMYGTSNLSIPKLWCSVFSEFSSSVGSDFCDVDYVKCLRKRTWCCFLALTGSSPTPNANNLQKEALCQRCQRMLNGVESLKSNRELSDFDLCAQSTLPSPVNFQCQNLNLSDLYQRQAPTVVVPIPVWKKKVLKLSCKS